MTNTKNTWPEKVRISFDETGAFEGIGWRFADAGIKLEGGTLVTYVRADLTPPQFTQEQLQSVVEALESGWRNMRTDYESMTMKSWAKSEVNKIRAAITLLQEMK